MRAARGVVQLLPGAGDEVGAALVSHPRVAQIAFTGSREVGVSILSNAGRVAPGQVQLKRVVCEMGGKNAIIVDDDADLDEAVGGILRSAFGYAGQKCSACSRLIVLDSVYDRLVPRLVEAARSIRVAPPEDPSCELGPVIDQASWQRLTSLIREPGGGVEPLFVGGPVPETGWFVPPSLFLVRDRDHPMARQELFGPVLSVLRAGSFDEALETASDSEYALTGGLYSRSPSRIKQARKRFRVGNLYINRETTGAMVDRQPFGGFGMSGGGTKAGGPGYLLNFVDPRVATENTMRRGFVI
ncbi:MAG: aldehyde dehydrogenase family protein [Spirochaetia bacterium]|jgi:RHH-type proline utilization regulon transcriptional repressor/proline dehydrogenase/delta 1-pyrroline-5-carboxylate dehydrogenase